MCARLVQFCFTQVMKCSSVIHKEAQIKEIILRLSIVISCSLILMICCTNSEQESSKVVKTDKLVDIGTHKLRVVLSDISSEYTIILESGGGKYSEAYQEVQDTLAKLTGIRVMSYDRSGFGQSELGSNVFNARDEMSALKRCLEVQGFKNNFILVGHS